VLATASPEAHLLIVSRSTGRANDVVVMMMVMVWLREKR